MKHRAQGALALRCWALCPGGPRGTVGGMGFPPPPDAPAPSEQAAVEASAGFQPSPSGTSLCGFGLPGFAFNLSFRLPFAIPPFPPPFNFSLGLVCSLSDPIDAEFGFGGGRVPQVDADADDELQAAQR